MSQIPLQEYLDEHEESMLEQDEAEMDGYVGHEVDQVCMEYCILIRIKLGWLYFITSCLFI